MRFDVISIFPDAFRSLEVGLLGKAIDSGLISVEVHDLRKWARPPHFKVDDEPFGGGPGMVMTPAPIVEAVESVAGEGALVIVLSASGRRFDQAQASELAAAGQVVLVCGRYEGIDQRAIELTGAREVSIGDFVLHGGEAAAAVVIEATARLVEGFMGNAESVTSESHTSGLLEHPHYTRPAVYRNLSVPEVLLSGNHGEVGKWRRQQALTRTSERRPDLLNRAELTPEDRALLGD